MKKNSILFMLALAVVGNAYAQGDQDNLIYHSPEYSIYKDEVIQRDFRSDILSTGEITSNYRGGNLHWKKHKDLSQYPQFQSDYLISDALYNLSVEEMTNLIEADGTWRTGELWGGVWTRDISYSMTLSMAYMRPDISKNSLMRKVRDGRIIQDTGTGGSYPVSTDRIVWSIAACLYYR